MTRPRNTKIPDFTRCFPTGFMAWASPIWNWRGDTFAARLFPFAKCWGQDGIEAALLGLTDEAKKSSMEEFTSYGNQQFRWFWSKNSDWIPDMDNGGAGMATLQLMLMQCDGKQIRLLPAWPDDWTADFKLHAPYQTTVEGHVEHGWKFHRFESQPRRPCKGRYRTNVSGVECLSLIACPRAHLNTVLKKYNDPVPPGSAVRRSVGSNPQFSD